ncbi:MAG: membrane protein insertase YidC [Aquincola sp.]|nr:membrane protein insertase YidC [Aquincola sp.]MDH5330370.1 membrane protein insertase YidC [Aquincola sp.]
MTDLRRTMLWVVFTMSLVMLWDAWNRHTGQPSLFMPTPARTIAPAASAPPSLPTQGSVSPLTGVPAAAAIATAPGASAAAASPPAGTAVPGASEVTVVTTDLVKASFDSVGGNLVRLELLKHADAEDRQRHVTLFDRSAERVYSAETGLITAQSGVSLPNHWTPMRRLPGPTELAAGSDQVSVGFESEPVGGVTLRKTYTLHRGSYVVDVRHEVINAGPGVITPQLYLQLARDGNPARGESKWYFTFTGPAVYTEAKKYQKVDFKDIEKGKASHADSANDGWVAMVQHYFASAWLVPAGSAREFRTQKVKDNLYAVSMVLPLGDLAPGSSKTQDAQLFAGPQEEHGLAALAPGLELVKDYGWFTVLAKPLFWVLDQLHKAIGNWGWAIVGLVVLLKITFYWLNASAYRSMAKMKALTPRLTDLRERYKEKPQLMQQEMMRIYREEKVNPLGGCLPILAQMPFFIALYWVLLSSVEMRNAPWIGWIHDLALPDPWFILPLLMTASSLFQVWLQPAPADPMQAKMMWMMPLIFGVMFFFFPAGLVLYWLTNNVLSIAQQWWINRRLGVK